MNDHELIRLAAKAAKIDVYENTDGVLQNRPVWTTMAYEKQWNPLRDDGDAFQLAVKLGLLVDFSKQSVVEPPVIWIDELCDNSTLTRRAIVLAAAQIGKRNELEKI